MNHAISASHRFEEVARLPQVGKPARTQFFPWRDAVDAENLIPMCDQVTDDKLAQPTTAARDDDFFHFADVPTTASAAESLSALRSASDSVHINCRKSSPWSAHRWDGPRGRLSSLPLTAHDPGA